MILSAMKKNTRPSVRRVYASLGSVMTSDMPYKEIAMQSS